MRLAQTALFGFIGVYWRLLVVLTTNGPADNLCRAGQPYRPGGSHARRLGRSDPATALPAPAAQAIAAGASPAAAWKTRAW